MYSFLCLGVMSTLIFIILPYSTRENVVRSSWDKIPKTKHSKQVSQKRNRLEFTNDWDGSSQLFVDHKSENSHHGGTAIVEFDGTLGELGLLIEGVPSEVKGSVTEVTDELVSGSFNVLHDEELEGTNGGDHLEESGLRDGVGSRDGGPSVRVGVEGVSGLVDGSGKVDTVSGGDLSKEGKHTNAAVLDLDESETVELFLVTVFNESERIEESERRLGSEGILEGSQGGGGLALLDRSESGSRGDKGGNNGGLHGDLVCLISVWTFQKLKL
mmetsp:Transcript_9030/g.22384  ORF Transcript_9030/g.22384 Transcript_9030/m.22384 type:complete len:271 (-) Transcript_9030:41-853(-)